MIISFVSELFVLVDDRNLECALIAVINLINSYTFTCLLVLDEVKFELIKGSV